MFLKCFNMLFCIWIAIVCFLIWDLYKTSKNKVFQNERTELISNIPSLRKDILLNTEDLEKIKQLLHELLEENYEKQPNTGEK